MENNDVLDQVLFSQLLKKKHRRHFVQLRQRWCNVWTENPPEELSQPHTGASSYSLLCNKPTSHTSLLNQGPDGQQVISLYFLAEWIFPPYAKAFNISAEEWTRVRLRGENAICPLHLFDLALNGYPHLSDFPLALTAGLSQITESS